MRLKHLQNYFSRHYKGRRKPAKIESLHCAITPKELNRFKANWKLVEKVLGIGHTRN